MGNMKMLKDTETNLILPSQFIDEKQALKKTIDELVDNVVNVMSHKRENYFLTLHAKFNIHDSSSFEISEPKVTERLPPFMSNTFVFFVSNKRGICEILWMVSAKKPGQKNLQIDFNEEGVAFLQSKGAMKKPS